MTTDSPASNLVSTAKFERAYLFFSAKVDELHEITDINSTAYPILRHKDIKLCSYPLHPEDEWAFNRLLESDNIVLFLYSINNEPSVNSSTFIPIETGQDRQPVLVVGSSEFNPSLS